LIYEGVAKPCELAELMVVKPCRYKVKNSDFKQYLKKNKILLGGRACSMHPAYINHEKV